jgi:hypothetical protein
VTQNGSQLEELLRLLRDRYLSEGFQFIIRPSRDLTPSFLGDYEPDAVALRGNGGVVTEIKSRRSAQGRKRMDDIARRFDAHPEWRFELIFGDNFVGDRAFHASPANVDPLTDREFDALRLEVATLMDGEHHNAALLMAWAFLEAAGRRALAGDAPGSRRPLTGWQLIEQLLHRGLIHSKSLDPLQNLLAKRNAVAHAVAANEATQRDVTALLELADDLAAGERA